MISLRLYPRTVSYNQGRSQNSCGDPEGVKYPSPSKKHKGKRFLANTGADTLEVTKLSKQHSMLAIVGPPVKRFKWCFASGADYGLLLVAFGSSLPSSTKKKTLAEVDPLLHMFLDSRRECYNCCRPWPAAYINFMQIAHQIQICFVCF